MRLRIMLLQWGGIKKISIFGWFQTLIRVEKPR